MKLEIKKLAFKYIFKFFMSAVLIFYIVIAPITVFPSLKKSQAKVNKEIEIEYMGILELWNIDTFEGGSVSRTNFLSKQALKFEKEHTGTFIMVYSMTVEQAKLNLENGQKPDMISFGIGVGDIVRPYLNNTSFNCNVRDDLLTGGKLNGDQLAIPYMFGGYVLIGDNNSQQNSKTIENALGFGENGCNNFSLALVQNQKKCEKIFEANKQIDSFTAYDKYLSKKFDTLCGTQRDLYRVLNRIEKGTMQPKSFEYLENFTDLVQYIGITTDDEIKQSICEKYIQKLLSSEVQTTIASYNMFSVNLSNIYSSDDENFSKMEKVLSKKLQTLNVFLSQKELDEIKDLSYEALSGNSDAIKKLSKYL